ncbi:MAG: hypothetical protein HS115_05745 [Spirochaetales bacterium]|nr:hypothetical protein [Spirochaetales bacterium]
MIRPLDMQVALHALPEQARSISAEQAGSIYRQVATLGQARQENLERTSRVAESAQAQATRFHRVDPDLERAGQRGKHSERDERERRPTSLTLLSPVIRRALEQEDKGLNMDLVA